MGHCHVCGYNQDYDDNYFFHCDPVLIRWTLYVVFLANTQHSVD